MFATIRIIVIFLLISLLAAGAWYVTGLRGQLAVSEINNQKMNEAVVLQQDLINQIKNEGINLVFINPILS